MPLRRAAAPFARTEARVGALTTVADAFGGFFADFDTVVDDNDDEEDGESVDFVVFLFVEADLVAKVAGLVRFVNA